MKLAIKLQLLYLVAIFLVLSLTIQLLAKPPQSERQKITIEQIRQLDFGVIELPTERAVTIVIGSDGRLANSSTANYIDQSEVSSGRYLITSQVNQTISISAYDNRSPSGFKLQKLYGRFDNGRERNLLARGLNDLEIKRGASKMLEIGAKLRISKRLAEGTYNPSFSLSIDYQ